MPLRPGIEQLERSGGQIGYVDAQGRFRVSLSQPGRYYVLILSKQQSRDGAHSIPDDERAILSQYFGTVDQLLTDRDYLLVSRTVGPEKAATVEYTFGE